jgi:hypothetical protein
MTGCKVPPSTEDRATSGTIRRARISLYCMAANAALGPSEKGPPDPTMARGLSPRQSPRGGPPAPRARNMTPFSFDKESAFVSAVGTKTKHSPGGYDEQWNYGQNQGRYQ